MAVESVCAGWTDQLTEHAVEIVQGNARHFRAPAGDSTGRTGPYGQITMILNARSRAVR